ncbi:hypothetical protein [Marinobacter salarius]|uniref:Uncharacterized protein n=1 Tax=Marinobacter salarius TaxID=1420917 RepID=A0A1W6KFZ9_9GAMM|nr:hypothetical protein [Marinobacter salarius]ARM86344.1 hypothetical protein MARSALSMR5_04327 [Marinobacter salarius]
MPSSPDISTPLFDKTDISCVWYNVDKQGVLTYTSLGLHVYTPLFRQIGVAIENVTSMNLHRDCVQMVVAAKQAEKSKRVSRA